MPKVIFYDGDAPRERVYIQTQPRRRYGCLGFVFDIIMTLLTGGLWLIWIFVREMRRR
jgi:hypothetical protein